MKHVLVLTLLLTNLVVSSNAQKTFHLRKNQTAVASGSVLLADTLILEDNSTLQVKEEMPSFTLIARFVKIGNNVTIEGIKRGVGSNGTNGAGGAISPGDCRSGNPGQSGTNGTDGRNGTDIFLYLRIVSLDGLTIHSPGTNGGNGGAGGNGSKGADQRILPSCAAQPGGMGGSGGNGGDGGRGGNIVFNYTFIGADGKFLSSQPSLSKVNFQTNGGTGGNGGIKGQKGEAGKLIAPSSTDPNKNVPEAINGKKGYIGTNGYVKTEAIKQDF